MRLLPTVGLAVLSLTSLIAAAPHHRAAHTKEREPRPQIRSESAIVRWADTKEVILSKNADAVRPIASVTKLVSGLVLSRLVGSATSTTAYVTIGEDDRDKLKWSRSRIKVGRAYRASDLFAAALGASDNRAMYASVRARGIERPAFVEKMNALAKDLGMSKSAFRDPAGIDPGNVSTATDLLALVDAAAGDEQIREVTRLTKIELVDEKKRLLTLHNPDRLVSSPAWEIVVGKTGYTIEAGRALVLRTRVRGRLLDMVFLGAHEMASVFGDAGRVRRWVEERLQKEQTLAAKDTRPATATSTTALVPLLAPAPLR